MRNAWFLERRLDYIEDMLIQQRSLSTQQVIDYFGVSPRQVGEDIKAYRRTQPHMRWSTTYVAYVRLPEFKPVRGSTLKRRQAWTLWKKKSPLKVLNR